MKPMINEWEQEPNSEVFVYKNYLCGIRRHPDMGHLCGYVNIPKQHPYYEKYKNNDFYNIPISCHGGITYAIHHDDVFTIGFDCGHFMDLTPYVPYLGGTYRNIEYVRNELKSMVEQLIKADKIKPIDYHVSTLANNIGVDEYFNLKDFDFKE